MIGSSEDIQEDLDLLNQKRGEIQRILGRRLRMKYCPTLTFLLDKGLKHSMKIHDLLQQVSKNTSS
ncbi:MAG: hypothetical protein D6797_02260 [Bdellovibrio sp.]|nr:MAG: hypothetical protein D6797_02260 [Bdellovibrio sp.]